MSISSDEINFLIYRYLQENGFSHSSFTFASESMVTRSTVSESDVPPGALITFLQKGLEYVAIEEHINEDGSIRDFETNYSLLSPLICDAVASKEDRRIRRRVNSNEPISEDSTNSATAMNHTSSNGVISKDSSTINGSQNDENNKGFKNGKSNGNGDSEESITAATSSTVSLRNESNVKLLNLSGHQGEVFMCVWNPSQTQLASGSADGMCRLWDLEQMDGDKWGLPESSNIKLRTCVMPHANVIGERFKDITSITWSPDGQYIATGCYTGEARIWDSKGALKMILKEHTGPVFSLKWNKQGNYLLSGSYDRRTVIWSPETGQIVKSFLLHTQPVLDVDWRDSDTFASCSSDMVIHVCKVSSPDTIPATTMLGHLDEVNAVSWSPGGHYLASCSDDTTAKIWSVEFGLLFNLRAHNKEIFTLRWTQTGPSSPHPTAPLLLCTASFDGTVKVWDGMKGNLMYSLGKHTQPVYSVSPSPSSFVVATGSLGGHVSVWSLLDGSLLHEMKGPGDTFDVSWSHDGSLLSACFSSGTLVVQDASVYKDVQFGNTLTPVPASQEGTNTESVVEAEGKPTATASSTYTHVTASKGSKHGAAASRAHAQSQSHQSSNTDREAASSGSKAVTEKGEKVTELKNDKVKGRSDSVATAVSTTATDMKVDEIIPAVENDPTTEADAMQVDTTSSSHGHGNADKDDLPASCSDEVNTPMDEVTASIVGDKGEVTDMITDDIDDKEKDRDGDL